jgi:hypothetical protein
MPLKNQTNSSTRDSKTASGVQIHCSSRGACSNVLFNFQQAVAHESDVAPIEGMQTVVAMLGR